MRPVAAPSVARAALAARVAPLTLALAGTIFAAACSDGGLITIAPGANVDAGSDALAPDTGSPTGDGAPADAPHDDTCGTGPWVEVDLVVKALSATGQTPLAGVTFTASICAGKSTTSDAMGNIRGKLSQSVPFYGRLQAMSYADMLTPEQKYDAAGTATVAMLPALFTGLIPGFATDKSVVFVGAMHDGGMGACDAFDGIALTVPGHPEAVVTYYSTDAIPMPVAGATSTTASGRASIAGLMPGPPVAVSAAKTGCVVETVHGVNTGRAPLEAGFVSLLGMWIHN